MGRRVLIGGVIVVTLAVLGYAGYAWHYGRTHVSTDDAYVEGNIAPIAAKFCLGRPCTELNAPPRYHPPRLSKTTAFT